MKHVLIFVLSVLTLTVQAQTQQTLTHIKSDDIRGIYKAGNKAISLFQTNPNSDEADAHTILFYETLLLTAMLS